MRDFHITREPSGAASQARRRTATGALPFVIQKHAATRLHYDFRLGWNGVLKSWAVTKGPSYYPGDKRLAVQVEDHPMEYGGFEGIIPKGQYGGGTVTKAQSATELPIRLTHPDKVLDQSTGVTKEILARYYLDVSASMLPYVAGRPLMLVRCVDGSGKPCFYQKHKNQTLGDGFGSVDVVNRKTGAHEPYITLSTTDAIVELAQMGVLELHPWGSCNKTMEQPDRIVIDLDPDPSVEWKTIAASAKEVRRRLAALGLKSFVKTTGGKGLHVVVPIRPEHEWPAVKQFTHDFVLAMEREHPDKFLTKMSKAARVGKIFLDYLRNDRGATAVAPYSPRAREGLPVAVPLRWAELDADEPPRFSVSNFQAWRKRLARDPWKEMAKLDQRLALF